MPTRLGGGSSRDGGYMGAAGVEGQGHCGAGNSSMPGVVLRREGACSGEGWRGGVGSRVQNNVEDSVMIRRGGWEH